MAYLTLPKKKECSFYHLIEVFDYSGIENSLWLNMGKTLRQAEGSGCLVDINTPMEHFPRRKVWACWLFIKTPRIWLTAWFIPGH